MRVFILREQANAFHAEAVFVVKRLCRAGARPYALFAFRREVFRIFVALLVESQSIISSVRARDVSFVFSGVSWRRIAAAMLGFESIYAETYAK